MAQNFLTCDREQPLLLPPDLHDWLDEDHLGILPFAKKRAARRDSLKQP